MQRQLGGHGRWVWLVRDLDDEGTDELGVAYPEGVGWRLATVDDTPLRVVGTWTWLLGGVWVREREMVVSEFLEFLGVCGN